MTFIEKLTGIFRAGCKLSLTQGDKTQTLTAEFQGRKVRIRHRLDSSIEGMIDHLHKELHRPDEVEYEDTRGDGGDGSFRNN